MPGSWRMSITSGTAICMRKASSYWLIRVRVSGSPNSASSYSLSCRSASSVRRRSARSMPFGIADVQDRVAHRPALHALVHAGQKAGAPEGLAAGRVRAAADQDDEAGQVLVLRAQAVGDPRAHRGPAVARRARVEEQLRRRMVELVGIHRLDDRDVVDRRRAGAARAR